MDEFLSLGHWHWWIISVILVGLEIFAPTTIFLWFGISAAITGFITFASPNLTWEYQIIIFSILSVISIVTSRIYLKKNPIETEQPKLNKRGQRYVGRIFDLNTAIENGAGKIRVDDTFWRVKAKEDYKLGQKVKVIGVEGTTLIVELV